MKLFRSICFTILFWGISSPVIAQTRSVTLDQSRLIDVALYRGHGVTLNFRPTGETIQRAWLDDLSKVTLDFDDPGCTVVGMSESCAASVIHLRRIHPLDFPDLPATATTTLTVLTNADLYTFRLSFPDTGTPAYSVLSLELNNNLSVGQGRTLTPIEQIEQGLRIAQTRRLISPTDPLWQRLQTCLQLMRNGVAATEAAEQAGVSSVLLTRLSEFGARR
jgi:hypothetical protein